MTRETLACEYDGHFWSRETTRGRKPKRCPKHSQQTPDSEVELAEVIGYVDVPVTLRSTKTSKEAPGSPVEPFTPRLATGRKGRGQQAASEPLDGRNGQNSLDPSPELPPDPISKIKDRAAGKILAQPEANLQSTLERDEKIASGEWQELYCQNGDHDWDRPTNRGRKPVNCPQHPNVVDLDAHAEERQRKAEERIDRLTQALLRNGTHISQHQEKEFTVPNRPEYQDKGPGQASHKDKPSKAGTSHKGMAKTVRATKRTEAEARNEKTVPERKSRKGKAA